MRAPGQTRPPPRPLAALTTLRAPPPGKPAPVPNWELPAVPDWFKADLSIKDVGMRAEHRQRDYFWYLDEPGDQLKKLFHERRNKIIFQQLEQQVLDEEASSSSSSDEPLVAVRAKRASTPPPKKSNNNKKRSRTLAVALQGTCNEVYPLLDHIRDEQELSDFQFRRVLKKYCSSKKNK